MNDNIQDKINKQAEESQNNILWGKPANDILNGRDYTSDAKPVRAIWEMVQNARDVAEGECNITFTRQNDTFEFKHDGMPFTNDTIGALILQTSAKSRNDGEQVGQYGTGFLTTHKFGRKFNLSGSLKLVDDQDIYYNFKDFTIDRTPNTREEMVKSLAQQFIEKNRWKEDSTNRSNTPSKWTIFTYFQPNEIEKKNVEEAFEQAPELIPYILCLNENIKTITFNDMITNHIIKFTRNSKQQVKETDYAYCFSTHINIDDTKSHSKTINIQTWESKSTVLTKNGGQKTMVTVIPPVNGNQIYPLSDHTARLFMYLPLIGTEQWGINFILHAPLFTCLNDDRSSLRLIKDGQTENDPAIANHEYIQCATDIIFDYLKLHLSELQDVHYLAPIYFDVTNPNIELSNYYKSIKRIWLQNMNDLNIVSVQQNGREIKKKPLEIYVVDSVIANASKENEKLLHAIYNVLSNMHKDAIPTINHIIYWSEIFAQWYNEDKCNQIVTIDEIVDYIDVNGLEAICETDLLTICQYLHNNNMLNYFDKHILITEEGTLMNKIDGYKSEVFCDTLKACIKVLLPEHTCRFVKEDFSNFIQLHSFNNQNIKEALSLCMETMQSQIKNISDNVKISKTTQLSAIKDKLLSKEQRNAIIDYCDMLIPEGSSSFQAKALELVKEYYNYHIDFTDTIDNNFFEWRSALRTLLSNTLTDFTLLPPDAKLEKTNWIKRTIACIYEFSDFKNMLQNYCIYLSQSNEFYYSEALKKDAYIPERMKDIYNILASSDDNDIDIRKQLYAPEFGMIAPTDVTYEVVILGNDIMNMIKKSGKYYENIDSYEHRDLIMDIINNFDNETDGTSWKNAFETIYKDLPSLLSKLVLNKENRESMIKIMKVKDKERLNKAAEIINDKDFISIWDMGKKAWTEKQNEQHDFEKKKELGNYVECCLRQELKEELEGSKLEVNIGDVQGGQDIIIFINEKPIYYIEVKSRWISADSVEMSATQLERSVEKKDCYSLFAVNMVNYNQENVKEHRYPAMDEFINRISILTNIGELNNEIVPTKRNPQKEVHIGGDYKAIVPQELIANNHINFRAFINDVLKPRLIEAINAI